MPNPQHNLPRAIAGALLLVLLLLGVLVWTYLGAGGGAAPAPVTAAAPVSPSPITASDNAANFYREAIELLAAGDAPDPSAIDSYARGGFDPAAAAFFDKHKAVLDTIRQGAALPACDWGQPSMEQRLAELNALRQLSNLIFAHARFAAHQNDTRVALDDNLNTLAVARHIGANRMLVDVMVQLAVETRGIDELARLLPQLSREQLESLHKRLDALPPRTTGQELLAREADFARQSIRQQQGGFVPTRMADALKGFYSDLGAAVDTQSPDEFANFVDLKLAEYKLNPFAQIAAPSLKRLREPMAVVQVRLAMLRCAIDVLVEGESAVARSRDPFGNNAPFVYAKTDGGFTLTSRLTRNNAPVTLSVGGQ